MTLQQLACFCATAENGSFNAAARAMHLTQPAVSDQVRRLERELGVALVRRTGRGLELTPDGHTFRSHAERVLNGAHDATASVGRAAANASRTVTFSMTRNAPYYRIAELVTAFAVAHPEIRLRLPGDNSASVAEAVRTRASDAGLVILPIDPRGLEIQTLFRDEILLVSAEPARVARAATVELLMASPLILYDTSRGFEDPTRRQLSNRAQAANIRIAPRYDVEHVEMAVELARQGLGDTIVARAITLQRWFPPELRSTSFAEPLYDHFASVTRAGEPPSSEVNELLVAFTSWGKEYARQ